MQLESAVLGEPGYHLGRRTGQWGQLTGVTPGWVIWDAEALVCCAFAFISCNGETEHLPGYSKRQAAGRTVSIKKAS